jgi:SAM-dependent methyltransferase
MRDGLRAALVQAPSWIGWCCPYCSGPLQTEAHGLFCPAEQRWFATEAGVHRLLSEERRREIRPRLEFYQRVRRDEGWRAEPGLPDAPPGHRHASIWRRRAGHFRRGCRLAEAVLGRGPWRVLEVGAGCCWAAARLLGSGHEAVAVDVNLDLDDGLHAADRLLPPGASLPRAEAEMELLPFEPALFDLVLAAGAIHHTSHLTRTLLELRRVTRRGGALLVLDSPVYRRREDGEAMVAERMKAHGRRYGVAIPREMQSGYLVLGELAATFRGAGWRLEVDGWPPAIKEWAWDALDLGRRRRRTARFPILLARRDG